MPKGIKGFRFGHKHSEKTRKKIGDANRKQIEFDKEIINLSTILRRIS